MKMQTQSPMIGVKNQQGAVLLWGLVGLLVLAGLGIAASRIATVDKRIAGNTMFDDFSYQGAEASLRRSTNLFMVKETAEEKAATNTEQVVGPYEDAIGSGGKINSSGTMSMGVSTPCPPILQGVANSTSAATKTGFVACRVFTVNVDSQVPGTAAESRHTAGILKYVPAE
jgi:Tfp pilus assembly protein PilX